MKDCFWNLFFHLDCPFNSLHFCFSFCIIIYILVCQYSFSYYWYCYSKNQLSGAVLKKRCSYKFHKIEKKKTPKKRFCHRCFLVNFAKFLIASFLKSPSDSCFTMNTLYVYRPTTTFLQFKNNVGHIFYFRLNL